MLNYTDCVSFIKNKNKNKEYSDAIEFSKEYKYIYSFYEFNIELGLSYYYNNDIINAQECWEKCYNLCKNSYDYELLMNNLQFCFQQTQNNFINYPENFIKKIEYKFDKNFITFTMTTCKRYDLFEKTINSFLNCCLDYYLIDKWIIVDDNSDKKDISLIKEKYPFFEIISKTKEQKGHAKSMNIIKNIVTSPYIFHIEDDWQFFSKRNYISELLEIMVNEGEKCGQVLVNKNYAETVSQNIIGGFNKNIGYTFYTKHEYYTGKELEKNNERGSNCFYWPHYSLRPSLLKTKIFNELGDFREDNCHFEIDYANKYISNGYYSCFLNGIFSKHIGKLTFEKHSDKPNAYVLNKTQQFGEIHYELSHDPSGELTFFDFYDINMSRFVINLDKRSDRYDIFQKQFKKYDFTRFSAIDGENLKYTSNIGHIFANNDYNFRKGIIGCALSHIQLLINLTNSNNDYYMIFEDDVNITERFEKNINNVLKTIKLNDIDILFFGTSNKNSINQNRLSIKILDKSEWHNYSYGGAFSYVISKNGAIKFLDYLNENSLTNAIDTEYFNYANDIIVGVIEPFLLTSKMCIQNSDDSNIQHNYNTLSNLNDYLELEHEYFKNINFTFVDDISNLKDKNYYISNKNNLNDNYACYKLVNHYIYITKSDYLQLLQNQFRLKNCEKYLI
jgi:GR25 family glycosyltransferase involved in LPS biosynthesis